MHDNKSPIEADGRNIVAARHFDLLKTGGDHHG
jgi:hypothetical protein